MAKKKKGKRGGARPGAGRPKSDRETVTKSVRIGATEYAEIERRAAMAGQTAHAYMSAAIDEHART